MLGFFHSSLSLVQFLPSSSKTLNFLTRHRVASYLTALLGGGVASLIFGAWAVYILDAAELLTIIPLSAAWVTQRFAPADTNQAASHLADKLMDPAMCAVLFLTATAHTAPVAGNLTLVELLDMLTYTRIFTHRKTAPTPAGASAASS